MASYHWIECPFRQARRRLIAQSLFRLAAKASIVLMAMGGGAIIEGGWARRFDSLTVSLDAERDPIIPYLGCSGISPAQASNDGCVLGDVNAEKRILVWGDSYALAWAPAFDKIGKSRSFAVELAWLSQCPALVGVSVSASARCRDFNERVAIALTKESYVTVVLVGSWGPYLDERSGIALSSGTLLLADANRNSVVFREGLLKTVNIATQAGSRVVVIGPTPGAPGDAPFKLASARAFNLPQPLPKSVAAVKSYDRRFWELVKNLGPDSHSVTWVDPRPWFCDELVCSFVDGKGRLLYRDGGHLSVTGSKFVASRLSNEALGMP